MFYITKQNLPHLLLGSLFFGTGGGIPYEDQKKIFENALKDKDRLSVKDIKEFKKDDYFISVYAVGDPSKATVDLRCVIENSIKEYQRLTNINVGGIIPGEIGAEGIAFQAAAYVKLPIVDSDLVGGRAAPEIQMDVFSAFNMPITPALGATLTDKSLVLLRGFSAKEVEETMRVFFKDNGGLGIVIGQPIKAGDYGNIAIKGTVSRALRVGEYIAAHNLTRLLEDLRGEVVAQEKIRTVCLKSEGDFLKGWVGFENFKLWIKNENIALFQGTKKVVVAPDLIVLLQKKLMPIHNTVIEKLRGEEVTIVKIPASGYWQDREKRKIWASALE